MLLRNKRTGFEYVYSPALANDPEFEVIEEQPPVVRQEQIVKAVIRKRVKKDADNLQPNPQ